MKQYAYYPGCSCEKMALSYSISAVECMRLLGVELCELEDWNCCGSTTYFHLDEILANTLCARNLAIAEQMHLDMVAPCAACYKNHYFANAQLKSDPDLAEHINFALEEDNLQYTGSIDVHHLIEIFVKDVGLEAIKDKVTNPLNGLRVAPYYGCQILRPRKDHEPVEDPQFFEELLAAVGAQPVDFPVRLLCCSGSLIISNRRAALSMVRNILQNAIDNQATVIATACPMCQLNLECYQKQVNQEFGTDYSIPVLFFTQIIGLALGFTPDALKIGTELVVPKPVLTHIKGDTPSPTQGGQV
jgi:heterodisulfide reductase subunit B